MTKIISRFLLSGLLAFVPLTQAADSGRVAELKKKLASLDADKQKELDSIERNLDAKLAEIKAEIGKLKLTAADLDKQLAELRDKNGPSLKELERLQQEREAINGDYQAKIAKAEKTVSDLQTAANQKEADMLSAGAKIINDAVVANNLSVELVPRDGKYPEYRWAEQMARYRRKRDLRSEHMRDSTDEAWKSKELYSAASEMTAHTVFQFNMYNPEFDTSEPLKVGDIIKVSPESDDEKVFGLAVVICVTRFSDTYMIDYLTFDRLPRRLADTSPAKQFVTLAKAYTTHILADDVGRAEKEIAALKEQHRLALRNWDYANGVKLEVLKNQAGPLKTRIDALSAKLATCQSDLAIKELVIGKPRAMQREELRQAVISRYEKDRATLSGQLASAQAEVEAARKRWWHDLFEYVYLSAIAVAVLGGAICFHGLMNKCPNCKRMWAAKVESRVVTGKSEGYDTVQETTTRQNSEGRVVGTSTRPVQRHYIRTHYDEHCMCRFCEYQWVRVKSSKSGGA